ncbi:MAG: RNA polymerase sigma factor [Candidatus Aminicenantia bacterium]
MDEQSIINQYWPIVSLKVKKEIGALNPDWEDLTNEIMIKVITALREGKFRGESSLGTFVYAITKHTVSTYKYLKKRNIILELKGNPVISSAEWYERKENLHLIAQKIKNLKFKYRQVLYLYYYQGLPRKTISRILDLPLKKVDERLNYALKLLKKELNYDFFKKN